MNNTHLLDALIDNSESYRYQPPFISGSMPESAFSSLPDSNNTMLSQQERSTLATMPLLIASIATRAFKLL